MYLAVLSATCNLSLYLSVSSGLKMRVYILLLLLVSRVQNQVGWSVFLVLYLGQHCVCVCVRACFHIVLHVSGISGIQIPSLEHMLASLSLIC